MLESDNSKIESVQGDFAISQGPFIVEHHEFFTSEVKPVRFGPLQDATSTLFITLVVVGFYHAMLCLLNWCRLPSATVDGQTIWQLYSTSSQFLIGGLLYLWIVGYNVVSWVIWKQFEQSDNYPADDFYIARNDRRNEEECALRAEEGGGGFTSTTLFHLPNGSLILGSPVEDFSTTIWRDLE